MISNLYRTTFLLVLIALTGLAGGCASNDYFSLPTNARQPLKPAPRINVYVMPQSALDLSRKKVLMVPAYMAGNQEEIWGKSVTSLIHSLLLQENVFGTLALNPDNHLDKAEMLQLAREKGFDYLLEIIMPGIIEPAGDSPGWVGINFQLISTRKGYSIWHIYGETQLLPQPTFHGFFNKQDYVPAPTVGQGIESITRLTATILKKGGSA